jgi:hypothetical protein
LTKGLASPLKSSASLLGAEPQPRQPSSNYRQPIALLQEACRCEDGNLPIMASKEPKVAKRKLLDDSDSESDDGGAPLGDGGSFKVNEEYARRFEYNKKREERQRCKQDGTEGSQNIQAH